MAKRLQRISPHQAMICQTFGLGSSFQTSIVIQEVARIQSLNVQFYMS